MKKNISFQRTILDREKVYKRAKTISTEELTVEQETYYIEEDLYRENNDQEENLDE